MGATQYRHIGTITRMRDEGSEIADGGSANKEERAASAKRFRRQVLGRCLCPGM
jgi:hypothetical protein